MKVLHIACIAPPDTGGIGQSASEMVKRLRGRGVESVLAAPVRRKSGGGTEPDAPWITRLPAPLRWGNAAVLTGVKSLIRSHDIVHLHYPFFGTAEGVVQDCLWLKKPVVMTFHMDVLSGGLSGVLFETYRTVAQPAILAAMQRVFVSSRDYAERSSLKPFLGAHPERVVELPFGVDDAVFAPGDKKAARQALSLPEDGPIVGFVGGMDAAHSFKGVSVFLQAFAAMPTPVHAVLVGEGPGKYAFEKQAKELGIAERCYFTGRLPLEMLVQAYRAMDIFTFPSTSRAESFGLVVVEAMACGTPVVASDLPGVRSVTVHQETGLSVPPSDAAALAQAWKNLLEDRPRLDAIGRAARERVLSRFSWDRHVDGLMDVYRKLVPAS